MILIGMLHHRKHPKSVIKAYAYAAVARLEGAELLFFSPKAVDFAEKVIYGYQYHDGEWKEVKSRFPDVIYNAGSPIKLKKQQVVIDGLRKIIPFTTNSIGNKQAVYYRLKVDGTFSDYLIPSHVILSLTSFMQYLLKYKKIVFKPVNGHKGQNIFFIEKNKDDYLLLINSQKHYLNETELINFIKARLSEEQYLVQPYIRSQTKNGNAYDFRLHTQKNGEGKWVITAIYPRIGPSGSIISNINSGGSTNYLEPFLKQEFGDKYFDIKQYLEQFALRLAHKMDELQKKYYNETIDELGIDVGLDESHKIWIYEVNWRPGCPPTFYLELDVVKNSIHYAMYLAKSRG
ncbi:MAG TPA: YheC/YheD family protein [Haloplasmataceae bacterium]